MLIDFDKEVEETKRKRKPEKARKWHLGQTGNNSSHNKWLRKRTQEYLNSVELSNADREYFEQLMYGWVETKKIDVYTIEELGFDPEEDAYLESLRIEQEAMIEEEAWFLKKATFNLTARQQEILNLYLAGYKQIEIAAILGVGRDTINKMFVGSKYKDTRSGGIIPALQMEIERLKLAKKIIALKDEGKLTDKQIARELGCSKNTVWKYNNKYRKQLEK